MLDRLANLNPNFLPVALVEADHDVTCAFRNRQSMVPDHLVQKTSVSRTKDHSVVRSRFVNVLRPVPNNKPRPVMRFIGRQRQNQRPVYLGAVYVFTELVLARDGDILGNETGKYSISVFQNTRIYYQQVERALKNNAYDLPI